METLSKVKKLDILFALRYSRHQIYHLDSQYRLYSDHQTLDSTKLAIKELDRVIEPLEEELNVEHETKE